jgi:hypothetical protein
MKLEVKRLDPIQTAIICALVHGAAGTVTAFLSAPLFLIPAMFGSSFEMPVFAKVITLIVGPIFAVFTGWVSGFVGAHVYNFLASRRRGLIVEVDSLEVPPSPLTI